MKGKVLRAAVLAFVLGVGFFLGTIYGNQGQAAGTCDVRTVMCSSSFIRLEIKAPVPIAKMNRHMFYQTDANTWRLSVWYNQ